MIIPNIWENKKCSSHHQPDEIPVVQTTNLVTGVWWASNCLESKLAMPKSTQKKSFVDPCLSFINHILSNTERTVACLGPWAPSIAPRSKDGIWSYVYIYIYIYMYIYIYIYKYNLHTYNIYIYISIHTYGILGMVISWLGILLMNWGTIPFWQNPPTLAHLANMNTKDNMRWESQQHKPTKLEMVWIPAICFGDFWVVLRLICHTVAKPPPVLRKGMQLGDWAHTPHALPRCCHQ